MLEKKIKELELKKKEKTLANSALLQLKKADRNWTALKYSPMKQKQPYI